MNKEVSPAVIVIVAIVAVAVVAGAYFLLAPHPSPDLSDGVGAAGEPTAPRSGVAPPPVSSGLETSTGGISQ